MQALWESATFGQSTDLNFQIGVLPEKRGVNHVLTQNDGMILKHGAAGPAQDVLLESRGGKIQPVHDGLTFYYTKLDPSQNFSLSADLTLLQFGPETHNAPNGQEACGIMLRDCNGPQRQEPAIPGYEEYPSASNMIALSFAASCGCTDGAISLRAMARFGVTHPCGNPEATFLTETLEPALPSDIKPNPDNRYHITIHCCLQCHNGAITLTYQLSDKEPPKSFAFPHDRIRPDILAVLDPQHLYAGFFAARNAQMSVSNISLKTAEKKGDTVISKSFIPAQNQSLETIADGILYISPTGAANGSGSQTSPLCFDAALRQIKPGQSISLMPGIYPPLRIPRSCSGTAAQPKNLISSGKALICPADCKQNALFILEADYWNISGLELNGKNTPGFSGFLIHGNCNTISECHVHHTYTATRDAGFTITAKSMQKSVWPSYNRLIRCQSYENHDATNQNADGFSCRGGVGKGNRLISCIAHNNADDGFDLYNNITDGPNGAVTLKHCVSYQNHANGFKLGGEGLEVPHKVINCIAFQNHLNGFSDNFNPGALLLNENVSYDNGLRNYLFRPSPYKQDSNGQPTADCILTDNLSFRTVTDYDEKNYDYVASRHQKDNLFIK